MQSLAAVPRAGEIGFELDHPEPERQLLGEPSTIASPEYTELERQLFGNPVPFCSGNRYITAWLVWLVQVALSEFRSMAS
jgi:hypothetical protein